MKKITYFLGALTLTAGAMLHADECTEIPPRCEAANNRAAQLLEEIMTRGGSEMADTLHSGYCAMLVGIEVNRFCAVEYRKAGRESCAQKIDAQIAMYGQSIPVFEESMDKLMVSKLQRKCHWE
jgi:hypothetical protein